MIWLAILLFMLGISLSFFFSGSETGFYRASRIRFLMDGLDGDRISKKILWLFNNPSLFMATLLVGNNVANNLVSLSIVLSARLMFVSESIIVEIIAPIAMAPVLFVYAESLPKSIYFMAPNRLLRRSAPLFLMFAIVLAPVSAALWSLSRMLESLLGQSPEKVRFALARRELQDVLQEGQEAGILHPTQRLLGQNFFLIASQPVSTFCTPLVRVNALPLDTNPDEALRFARRNRISEVPLYDGTRSNLVAFLRTIDLLVRKDGQLPNLRPLKTIRSNELYGEALLQMQTNRQTIALVVNKNHKATGLLTIDQLTDPLFTGPLGSLKR